MGFRFNLLLLAGLVLAGANGQLNGGPNGACPADIVFILDASGSVGRGNWDRMLEFVANFTRDLEYGPQASLVGVLSFGNQATAHIFLGSMDQDDFVSTVTNIPYKDENTNTASGIRLARERLFTADGGDRPDYPNVAIVVTDGNSTREVGRTIPEANLLKDEKEALVFAIGVSGKEGLFIGQLEDIASDPSEIFVMRVLSFEAFGSMLQETLTERVCGAIASTPVPSTPTTSTTTTTSTSTTTPTTTESTTITTTPSSTSTTSPTNTTASTPAPTIPEQPSLPCYGRDICFVLDISGSIGDENWVKMKTFVKRFVQRIPLGFHLNQVGLVTYSTRAWLNLHLNEVYTHSQFEARLDSIALMRQRTNTSGGVRMARRECFEHFGNRADRPDVMVVISDGQSNVEKENVYFEGMRTRSSNIAMFSIGVGKDADMDELGHTSSSPYQYYRHILQDYDQLLDDMNIFQTICAERYRTPAPVFYMGSSVDVLILLDVSRGLNNSVFTHMLQAIVESLSALDMSQQRVFFILASARTSLVEIRPNSYSSLQQLQLMIRNLPFPNDGNSMNPGEGNDALQQAMTELLFYDNRVTAKTCIWIADVVDGTEFNTQLTAKNMNDRGIALFIIDYSESSDPEYFPTVIRLPFEYYYIKDHFDFDFHMTFPIVLRRVIASVAPVLESCSFEDSSLRPTLCDITQSTQDDYNWDFKSGPTPSSQTGPELAHSPPYYIYLEATERLPNTSAVLTLPAIPSSHICIWFWYSMYGHHCGSLQVLVTSPVHQDRIVWIKYGPQNPGSWWWRATVDVQLESHERVVIKATRALGYSGDISIDDIEIRNGTCAFDWS